MGFPNKILQNELLKATEMYFLLNLKARSQKSRYQQGHAPSETKGTSSSSLFLVFADNIWHSLEYSYITSISLHHHMAFPSVFSQGCLLIRTMVI